MSRIIIKNIPGDATPESLRSHISSTKLGSLIITDIHIARKPDGTPRRFAFVGFKTEEQAKAAQKWHHQTFWGTQKISAELVQGVKDAPAPRPNKRPRLVGPEDEKPAMSTGAKFESLAQQDSNKTSKAKSKTGKVVDTKKEDAVTKEYLSLSRRKKGAIWADGPVVDDIVIPSKEKKEDERARDIAKKGNNPSPEPQDDIAKNSAISDLEWMKARMSSSIRESREFEQSDDEDQNDMMIVNNDNEKEAIIDEKDVTRQTILSTRRLFLRNLTYSCTSDQLQEQFSKFGEIEQVHIPVSQHHSSKGIAFILFKNAEDAVAAWEALDGTSFQGRLLHIMAGVQRRTAAVNSLDGTKKSLKEEKVEKRKHDAGKSFIWAMLYMNSDAVASSIAHRLNISKADLLGASEPVGQSSQNPAVKLALAETHIIQETKRYFEEQGIILEAFAEKGTPRSRTIILVKNIPYGTSPETLRSMFTPFGEVNRLLMPPSGTLAVVEFLELDDAAHAFRSLAYRRLGNSIIYLEWAPEGLIAENAGHEHVNMAVKVVTIREQEEGDSIQMEPPMSVRSGSTLFVKNLSFSTTSERLAQVFRGLTGFSFARIQTKPAPPNRKVKAQPDHEKLSMGYGFVGFQDVDSAKRALQSMQGFVLDGHKLFVTFAGRGAEEGERMDATISKAKTAKMIVKNVPFEASRKDLRDLFGVYGSLKSVRLPQKIDSRSRGFAFLEFVSRREAENAFAALRHTHLLGRHLVLDWADEGEQDIDILRRKVGVGFGGGNEVPGRKRKLEMTVGEDEIEE